MVTQQQEPAAETGPRPPALEAVAKWTVAGLLILAIMALCFGLGFGTRMATEKTATSVSATPPPSVAAGTPNFSVLNEIYADIKANYVDASTISPQVLRQGAIDGLIKAVGDPHMAYLDQATVLGEADSVNGSFSGIGATVQQKNGQLLLTPLPNTPAAKAGLKPDDVLVSVDGVSAKGWTDLQAVQKIRGPRGTPVKIGIKHADGTQNVYTITRDTINIDSVHTLALHDAANKPVTDIGYVKIDQFTGRTPQELKSYLDSIKSKNYKGLIIDLRNNPGGLVTSVEQVAGEFLNQNPVLVVQHKDGTQTVDNAPSDSINTTTPLAILVNHDSASAAEILSGALRDDRHAKLIGENTFGKGTENVLIPLKTDPGAVYVTVARWLTPSHMSIEGTGLKPDIAVTAANNQDPNATFNDVLYRAITYLQTGK